MALYKISRSFPSLHDFCEKYRLPEHLKEKFDDEGFETVAALLDVKREALVGAGFGNEDVTAIGKALRAFLKEQGINAW